MLLIASIVTGLAVLMVAVLIAAYRRVCPILNTVRATENDSSRRASLSRAG